MQGDASLKLRWGSTFILFLTQALAGLSEVSLADSRKSTRTSGGRAILKASPCQWIDLEKVREEGNGCVDGSKFVVSKERGVSNQFDLQCRINVNQVNFKYDAVKVRRQYLFVDGRAVLAFVTNGEKFAQCANFTDITADVKCKVICRPRKQEETDFQVMEGVENVELASECSSSVTTTSQEGESSPFLLFV